MQAVVEDGFARIEEDFACLFYYSCYDEAFLVQILPRVPLCLEQMEDSRLSLPICSDLAKLVRKLDDENGLNLRRWTITLMI